MSSERTVARLSRLLAMIPWVIANPGRPPEEVQQRFGYTSQGDLVKDLETLFLCGLPGYGPDQLMDMYIDDDEVSIEMAEYFAAPLRLTAAEALVLLAAGSAVLSSGLGSSDALERAVAKLRAVIAPPEIFDVGLDPSPGVTPLLEEAVRDQRVVRITHASMASHATTERDIEPWSVFTTLGNWYVVAHCRRAAGRRVFRVDRIREAEVLDETFEPPSDPPDESVTYRPGPEDSTARIRLEPQASWVVDYYPVDVVDRGDDGTIVIDFAAQDPMVTARLLLRLGTGATLLSGDEAARSLDSLRSSVLDRYKQSSA
jgi:proteasome accessory factor C